MSIIFGALQKDGRLVTEEQMRSMAWPTASYGTEEANLYLDGSCGMGHQPCLSHERSALDRCPCLDGRGNAIVFDGRLDNYGEIANTLELQKSVPSDSRIILAAFERWGEACFSRFVGDWAAAIWSKNEHALYLARDHAGTRTLYLREDTDGLLWSTFLDSIVESTCFPKLSLQYVSAYLTGTQLRELTPYVGVSAVLPGHYVRVCRGRITQHLHWNSLITSSIGCKDDAEYERRFLDLFSRAVQRRTGPGAPLLGQLSGGMDSTSIVCLSDHLRRLDDPDAELVDTVSYYDTSDPSFNDATYSELVERRRRKAGTHIDIAFSRRTFAPCKPEHGRYLLPGADSFSFEEERDFFDAVWSKGYSSILSGIGGDEVLGGVPNGYPELAGHLVSGHFCQLLRQAIAWSLVDRDPLIATLLSTARLAVGLYTGTPVKQMTPPWLSSSLKEQSRETVAGRRLVYHLDVTPHQIDNHLAWWSILETMPHRFPGILYRPEYRYPFLDKDLVNYLFSIPREQLLRPGHRRSLMRRALRSIVPAEILNRRRKAFQLSGPLRSLGQAQPVLERLFTDSRLASAGFVDEKQLCAALGRCVAGDSTWWQLLLKAIALELWLRSSDGAGSASSSSVRALDRHKSLTA